MSIRTKLGSSITAIHLTDSGILLGVRKGTSVHLSHGCLSNTLSLGIRRIGLRGLNLIPQPLRRPFTFAVKTRTHRSSLGLELSTNSLGLHFHTRDALGGLVRRSSGFISVLAGRVSRQHLSRTTLHRILPSTNVRLRTNGRGPIDCFLTTGNVSCGSFGLDFKFAPRINVGKHATIRKLHVSSLRLSAVFFAIGRSATHVGLRNNIVGNPGGPRFIFHDALANRIHGRSTRLAISCIGKGKRANILFNVGTHPLARKRNHNGNILLGLVPTRPVVTFHGFRFTSGDG